MDGWAWNWANAGNARVWVSDFSMEANWCWTAQFGNWSPSLAIAFYALRIGLLALLAPHERAEPPQDLSYDGYSGDAVGSKPDVPCGE